MRKNYARPAHARALPSTERRVAHSDAVLRESFMHVHSVRCILIHATPLAGSRCASVIRLQPFGLAHGTLANACRPTHGAAFQPIMK